MIQFVNGPAVQASGLLLRRAPLFLRVVHDPNYATAICKKSRTEWDALDMPGDAPRLGENVYAYRRVGAESRLHLKMSRPRQSGWYMRATYRFVDPQPTDQEMRDQRQWENWCTRQLEAELQDEERGAQ